MGAATEVQRSAELGPSGRLWEIEIRLAGDKLMPTVSKPSHFSALVDVHTAWDRYEAMRQSQTVLRSAQL